MNAPALHNMVAGFDEPSLGSQRVFRVALDALARPGRIQVMPQVCALPRQGHGAAAALLLGLLDADTSVWLSPLLAASETAAWLRFHTGCQLVNDVASAQFLWVGQGEALPALAQMRQGTDAYPDQSATCVIEVSALQDQAHAWQLKGPGIADVQRLQVNGLPDDFQEQWAHNAERFPKGVDVFMCTSTSIVGLPRTTQIMQGREN